MYLKKHFFSYIVFIFVVFLITASYTRFVVENDYIVAYEGDCDPYTESCYLWCEDDECSEPFYFSVIERHAAEIYSLCGEDVTVCDDAYYCDESVEYCEIYFCDAEFDGEDSCEYLTEEDYVDDFSEL